MISSTLSGHVNVHSFIHPTFHLLFSSSVRVLMDNKDDSLLYTDFFLLEYRFSFEPQALLESLESQPQNILGIFLLNTSVSS